MSKRGVYSDYKIIDLGDKELIFLVGAKSIRLTAFNESKRTINFYHQHGFEEHDTTLEINL